MEIKRSHRIGYQKTYVCIVASIVIVHEAPALGLLVLLLYPVEEAVRHDAVVEDVKRDEVDADRNRNGAPELVGEDVVDLPGRAVLRGHLLAVEDLGGE